MCLVFQKLLLDAIALAVLESVHVLTSAFKPTTASLALQLSPCQRRCTPTRPQSKHAVACVLEQCFATVPVDFLSGPLAQSESTWTSIFNSSSHITVDTPAKHSSLPPHLPASRCGFRHVGASFFRRVMCVGPVHAHRVQCRCQFLELRRASRLPQLSVFTSVLQTCLPESQKLVGNNQFLSRTKKGHIQAAC